MDFLFPYSETKLKPYLKMAVQRIQIHNNKKTTAVKIQKREVGQLLRDGKDEKAKIRAEHIIREDFNIEGLEILELILELIHERIKQITNSKEVPPDLKEAVCSVIWAAHLVDIPELKEVSSQLVKKYGSKFAESAIRNENNVVNMRLFSKLTYRPPSKLLVRKYLEEIAKSYEVEWEPNPADFVDEDLPFGTPAGTSIPMAPGSQLSGAYSRSSSELQAPPQVGHNNVAPHLRLTEQEIAEYEQFLNNQVRNNSNASVPGGSQHPHSIPYVYNDHDIITQTEVPIVEAQIISSSVPLDELNRHPGLMTSAKNQPTVPPATAAVPQPPPPAAFPPPSPPVVQPNPPTNPAGTGAASPPIDPLDALQARLAALNRRTP